MRTWIKVVVAALLIAACAVLAVALAGSRRQAETLAAQVAEQNRVIDSLLARRMTVMDVRMHVTDRSTSKVYGRYNRGTITLETEKRYVLEVDSTNVRIR